MEKKISRLVEKYIVKDNFVNALYYTGDLKNWSSNMADAKQYDTYEEAKEFATPRYIVERIICL